MGPREKVFFEKYIEYRTEYNNTPWWRFAKRRSLRKSFESALELMVKYNGK